MSVIWGKIVNVCKAVYRQWLVSAFIAPQLPLPDDTQTSYQFEHNKRKYRDDDEAALARLI
jgi:hypothetical protein